jgi:hypothetical protein
MLEERTSLPAIATVDFKASWRVRGGEFTFDASANDDLTNGIANPPGNPTRFLKKLFDWNLQLHSNCERYNYDLSQLTTQNKKCRKCEIGRSNGLVDAFNVRHSTYGIRHARITKL